MDNFITETQRESLIELYVGYFDRAPEEAGLNYWSQEFLSGLQSGKEEAVVLKEIADQFYSAGVQFGVYSSAMTIEEFIKTGYKNALGRDLNAESAVDRDIAVNYWSEQLNSGAVSRGQFIMQLVSDAKAFEGDATWGWVADYMANRVAVSKWFAENSDYLTDNDAIVQGTQALTVVTEATVKAGQTAADAVSAAEAAAATSDLFTLTVGAVSVEEGGNATFALALDSAPTSDVTVNYVTATGTAGSSDYTSVSGTVTFAAGQTSQFVTIATTEDSAFEADETFTVTFSGSSLTASVTATGTITNDDVDPSTQVQTYTLTTGADTGPDFTGTDADDVFNADFGPGLGGALTQQTLQGFDTLDGGEGNDTLNAELGGIDSLGGSYNPRISNIEQYNLTANNDGYLDLHRSSGYEEIWNKGSRADMTLDNLGEVATLGMDGVRDGAEFEVNYDNIAVETQKVVVNKSGAEGERVELKINGVLNGDITNLDLNVSNGVHLRLDNDAADIDNLTIAGDGILDLVGEDQFEFLQTLDTLGYDGDVTLDISGSGSLTSVLTGDGSDTITAAAANFSADTPPTTLDLGAGENRLILEDTFETQPEGTYTGGGLIDSAELSALNFTLAPVSNVQTLTLADVDLDGDASLALEGVGGLETLEFQDFANDVGDDLLINGTPETLTINGTSASSSADDADFDMKGGQLTVNGVRNLVVNTGDDLAIDGGLKGHTLETLELNAADNADLFISTGSDVVNGELDALTSIEVNAGVAEGASNSDAYVHIDDMNGSLTTGLTALESISVAAQDDASLELNGTNNALTGAQTVLADAQAAQADAATDLADAQAEQTAAEAALAGAQADQDAKVLDQAAAAAAQADAQADFDAAEADQIAAQGVYGAALAADTAADAAVVAAQDALDTAQDTVDTFNAYLAAFSFNGGPATSAQNISDIKTYILANNDLTTDQKNELIDLVPVQTNPILDQPFNSAPEFNSYLAAASTFLKTDLDIATLTTTWNDAVAAALLTQTALNYATTDLNNADAVLGTATTALATAGANLATADANLATADAAVATATDELLDAVVEVDHAEHALDDADAAVIAAQAAVDAALDDGTGFEALHTVTVEATDGDADVELTDVYGAVSLDVTAADNAWIDLFNTEVTSVTATAAHVDIDVAGDTVGNSALTTITVTATTADITLADNLSSFETLDVLNVSDYLAADTSGADFGSLALGEFITYSIGATSDGIDGTTDVDFLGNAAREVYDFAGGDIGEIVIDDFTWGADPATGDRLDLSDFASNAGELVFSDVGTDLVITDLNGGFGEFGGSITILGAAGQGFELGQFNILYA